MTALLICPIVFVSDFGYRNEWVGICHAVIARLAPSSRVIDLSHGVPPLDVRGGALLLADSLPYLGDDAVVVAVVDPSVGRDRDLAVETSRGRLLVGPDNGLLAFAREADGGVKRAHHEVTSEAVVLAPVAPSFHARDCSHRRPRFLLPAERSTNSVRRSAHRASRSWPFRPRRSRAARSNVRSSI